MKQTPVRCLAVKCRMQYNTTSDLSCLIGQVHGTGRRPCSEWVGYIRNPDACPREVERWFSPDIIWTALIIHVFLET